VPSEAPESKRATAPSLTSLDLFVRDLLNCDEKNDIKARLGPLAWDKIVRPAASLSWFYLVSNILATISIAVFFAAIFLLFNHKHFIIYMFLSAALFLPFLILNTTTHQISEHRLLSENGDNNYLKAFLFLHRKLRSGEASVYSEEQDFGKPKRIQVAAAYYGQDHGILKLLGTEAPKNFQKIGHWRRYSSGLLIDTNSLGELPNLVTLRKLCCAPRQISKLSETDFQFLVEQLEKVETVKWRSAKGLNIMTAFRELYRLKETKDKAIDELIERADFKQVSADTIREIIEGKNQSFNSKLDHGSMELLTRYIDDDKRLTS
jgi:hypothetical protein